MSEYDYVTGADAFEPGKQGPIGVWFYRDGQMIAKAEVSEPMEIAIFTPDGVEMKRVRVTARPTEQDPPAAL